MKISTGKGTISLPVLLAIWSVSAVTSLPGLAVSPILGDLNTIFPSASDLEIQMLTSLPSLLIIPFVLLSGKLSVGRDKLWILVVGLVIFLLSGIACLFIRNITALILVSCILGIGAGMVIPLSTGLVVAYFTGEYRVRQLGYSSSINNLTLVLATALSGYLANIDWHLSFLVDGYHLPKAFSGVLISLFFLAIMAPGLILDRIIGIFKGYTNVAAIAMIGAGLFCFGIFRDRGMLVVGASLAGFGYGLMQPLIYDKTAIIAPPRTATLALSFVMAVNYLAIMLCPFLIDTFTRLTALHSDRVPFLLNGMLTAGLALLAFRRRDDFTLGLDTSYYKR